jgi:hypothetical protein
MWFDKSSSIKIISPLKHDRKRVSAYKWDMQIKHNQISRKLFEINNGKILSETRAIKRKMKCTEELINENKKIKCFFSGL